MSPSSSSCRKDLGDPAQHLSMQPQGGSWEEPRLGLSTGPYEHLHTQWSRNFCHWLSVVKPINKHGLVLFSTSHETIFESFCKSLTSNIHISRTFFISKKGQGDPVDARDTEILVEMYVGKISVHFLAPFWPFWRAVKTLPLPSEQWA